MKDLFVTLAALAGFVGMRAAALIWLLVKVFILLCILFGAFAEIFDGYTPLKYAGATWWDTTSAALNDFGGTVADNWAAAALILIFAWVLAVSRRIKRLATDITHTKLAAVTTLNYLELEVETEGMKEIKDVGLFQMLRNALEANIWGGILGMREELTDDAVTAKATRRGQKVRMQDDVREWISNLND